MFVLWLYREVQVMESQGGSGATEGGGGDGQSGQAASTALIEKILSEEPRWQGSPSYTEISQAGKAPLHNTFLLFTLNQAALVHCCPSLSQLCYYCHWQIRGGTKMSPHSTFITFILTQTRNDSVKEASVTALHQVSRTKAAQR